jgi:hypothetical protein
MLGIRRHEMNPRWKGQLVPVNIGAERLGNVADQRSTAFGGQLSDCLGHRQSRKMTGDELRRQWELRRLNRWSHVHVPETRLDDEIVQCRGVMKRAGGSCHGGGLGADMSPQSIGKGDEIGCVTDGAPHREGQSAPGTGNSTQLPECLDTIGEELHTLLTEDYIENTTFEWWVCGVTRPPLDRGSALPA